MTAPSRALSIAMPLFDRVSPQPDLKRVARSQSEVDLGFNWRSPTREDDAIVIEAEGIDCIFKPMEVRVPEGELEFPARTAWHWPEARAVRSKTRELIDCADQSPIAEKPMNSEVLQKLVGN